MAKTLLNAVNDVAKRLRLIGGDAGAFSSLTDSARQTEIDVIVQVWNQTIRQMYSLARQPLPIEEGTDTITLQTGVREYDLPADLLQIRYPLTDSTNNNRIWEYPGGFDRMDKDQIDPDSYTGLPRRACISPQTGKLRFDYAPTAADNGKAYTLRYDKEFTFSAAADTFPFPDAVEDALVPVVADIYRAEKNHESPVISPSMMGQAVRVLTRRQVRTQW